MPFTGLAAELAALEAQGLTRQRRVLASPQGVHVVVDGREFVAFCSNDYLGLAGDARLAAAAREGAARYGVGAGASHLILGHAAAHHALEAALAQFVGLPRALLFSTGYMANLGIVTALAGRADAVFSMDGDLAPVPALLRLCERYDAWLVLDDAHGFGVLGETGAGVLQHYGVASGRIIYMATLGKAAGVFGAFVAGEPALIELLVQRARPYIYTTAMPPLLAHTLLASLGIIAAEAWRRERLAQLIARLKRDVTGLRWRLLPSDTAIQPLIIGANDEALRVSEQLAQRGLLVPAIRPPTVPPGSARLRISLSAAHGEHDVAQLVEALREIEKES